MVIEALKFIAMMAGTIFLLVWALPAAIGSLFVLAVKRHVRMKGEECTPEQQKAAELLSAWPWKRPPPKPLPEGCRRAPWWHRESIVVNWSS